MTQPVACESFQPHCLLRVYIAVASSATSPAPIGSKMAPSPQLEPPYPTPPYPTPSRCTAQRAHCYGALIVAADRQPTIVGRGTLSDLLRGAFCLSANCLACRHPERRAGPGRAGQGREGWGRLHAGSSSRTALLVTHKGSTLSGWMQITELNSNLQIEGISNRSPLIFPVQHLSGPKS